METTLLQEAPELVFIVGIAQAAFCRRRLNCLSDESCMAAPLAERNAESGHPRKIPLPAKGSAFPLRGLIYTLPLSIP